MTRNGIDFGNALDIESDYQKRIRENLERKVPKNIGETDFSSGEKIFKILGVPCGEGSVAFEIFDEKGKTDARLMVDSNSSLPFLEFLIKQFLREDAFDQ
jgi:hypothetical protein